MRSKYDSFTQERAFFLRGATQCVPDGVQEHANARIARMRYRLTVTQTHTTEHAASECGEHPPQYNTIVPRTTQAHVFCC